MKVIFLDIDGPLLSHRTRFLPQNAIEWCRTNVPPLPEAFDRPIGPIKEGADRIRHFDPVACELLRRLTIGHSARIVISSSWQKVGRRNMEFILEENGIPGEWLHPKWRTDFRKLGATRAQEIRYWLEEAKTRGEHIAAYAAIDDDVSVLSLPGGVFVPYSDGLRWCDFCSASAALGGGVQISNLDVRDGILTADLHPGPLGETVILGHGRSVRSFEFGPIEPSTAPAPPGCLRLHHSHYQLVRVAEESRSDPCVGREGSIDED
ncbi:HAD domain-containing protein [Ferrovibrio sp.]|uniref:HAD domain-containing protein n=1 Tax=Ferrovibrio sp. TaxID=1917215 RepID=UPI003512C0B7